MKFLVIFATLIAGHFCAESLLNEEALTKHGEEIHAKADKVIALLASKGQYPFADEIKRQNRNYQEKVDDLKAMIKSGKNKQATLDARKALKITEMLFNDLITDYTDRFSGGGGPPGSGASKGAGKGGKGAKGAKGKGKGKDKKLKDSEDASLKEGDGEGEANLKESEGEGDGNLKESESK